MMCQEMYKYISKNYNGRVLNTFGADLIEQGAVDQMNDVMSLPITLQGALMPDAHPGYGMPIGGVADTTHLIPYAVGVDIGCSVMVSTLIDIDSAIAGNIGRGEYADVLEVIKNNTRFSKRRSKEGTYWEVERERHPFADQLFEDYAWQGIPILEKQKDIAERQLGTSGGGNHFVEFGVLTDVVDGESYFAIASHSGSRNTGAMVCRHYTEVAEQQHPDYGHLAWLEGDAEFEYQTAMNMMYDYAYANHLEIHTRISDALGAEVREQIWNAHNYAEEIWEDDIKFYRHRKGATPIRGAMPSYIPTNMLHGGVLIAFAGGCIDSLLSASHGCGRTGSRNQARKQFGHINLRQWAKDNDILLHGAAADELPMAYKDPDKVLEIQERNGLFAITHRFKPNVVRMAG